MKNIVKISGLHKVYASGTHALKGINLNVKEGEFCILLGLSGSGKSTLLRCMNKLIDSTSGEIEVCEGDVVKANGKELRHIRRQIGMIFQQFNLIKNVSVLTNVLSGKLGYVSLSHSVTFSYHKADINIAMENLKRVGLKKFAHQKVKNLSGGQQQRVAIARALMQNPRIILADEPVASLDPATADSVMKYLGELNKNDNMTVLCSLHFLSLARKYGTRVVALKDGEIVYEGTPKEIDETKFKEIYGEDAEEVEIK
ncbi:MAG: phosphonate ABC transporter ATP-binding protein [Candidatus Cloacimonetes bacterium]|nr:phosphonate ABC transporter ATP-binding protein [Candidatus Cloacimonadota bacterium]MCF7814674.1 phosphonate ABC transporter ATP-binding protein [Candidatus Cloacimonadota bacterium]MCF7868236.1 phosphonate ABC transporter ATP-binding protein [Candidatus Cloacimonadota bacterium]MCF7883669.1 phosphonate ABC transporter ATP-binding protein [Candidatus Cloacimonadota bacterium]